MSRFIEALSTSDTPIVMEVKLRAPDGRDLLGRRTVEQVVAAYQAAGAPCLSVVTGKWFGGRLELLRDVALATRRPILQKDFITRDSQLEAARDLGASAVLLTAGLLTRPVLQKLIDLTLRCRLTPFVEVTCEAEIESVTHASECVIAVNNKDIKQRELGRADLERAQGLLPAVLATGTRCPVNASGIETPGVAADLIASGYRGLLVGTSLLRTESLTAWLTDFTRATRLLRTPA